MSKLVNAYDTKTGRKLEHLVPEHWIGHPKFGPTLSKTPRAKAGERKRQAAADSTTETPAAGETKE